MKVFRPSSAIQAQQLKAELRTARFAAGATALQLSWVTGSTPSALIDLGGLPRIRELSLQSGHLRIGAMVSLETLRTHPLIRRYAPLLAQACQSIGSLAIRCQASIGGNIAWRHGDCIAPLLLLDAQLERFDGQWLALSDVWAADDWPLFTSLRIPAYDEDSYAATQARAIVFYEKVAGRAAFAPTRLAIAFRARNKQGLLHDVRSAASSVHFAPRGLHALERAMEGTRFSDPQLQAKVQSACAQDFVDDTGVARIVSKLVYGRLEFGDYSVPDFRAGIAMGRAIRP